MTKPPQSQAVLFDAAGTLIELADPLGETYASFAARFGVELPAWRIQDAFGRVFDAAPPMLFADAAPDEVDGLERAWWRSIVRSTFLATDSTLRFADFDGFFAALYDHYAAPTTWRPRPGALEALRALDRSGMRLGVVSNFDGRLPGILAGLGLEAWLSCIVLPSEARALKPDPRIFEAGLARLGAAPERAIFVGDDARRDLAGARNAGLRAIDVADLATLADLPAHIQNLEERRA